MSTAYRYYLLQFWQGILLQGGGEIVWGNFRWRESFWEELPVCGDCPARFFRGKIWVTSTRVLQGDTSVLIAKKCFWRLFESFIGLK